MTEQCVICANYQKQIDLLVEWRGKHQETHTQDTADEQTAAAYGRGQKPGDPVEGAF